MTLQGFLTRLIWLCVAPLALLSAYLVFDSVQSLQSAIRGRAEDIAMVHATSLDQYLRARIRALSVLAVLPHADQPSQWDNLYREALAFREQFGSDVVLADAETQMLFNTRVPLGTPLPRLPVPQGTAAVPRALASGKPAVGDIFFGPIARKPLVAMAVPGLRDGKVAFLLLATYEGSLFQERLDELALPPGWALTLRDSVGTIIARRAPPGFDPATDVDASEHFAAKLATAPWQTEVEIPRRVYRNSAFGGAGYLVLFALGAMLVGPLGGMIASRRLGRSVASLVDPAAQGGASLDIAEIAAARRLLDDAAQKRAAAEAGHRDSEDRYRDLVENSRDLICTHDLEGRVLSANAAAYRMLGLEPGSLVGRNLRDLLTPETRAQFPAYLAAIKAQGSAQGVMAVQTRAGGVRYWEYHNTLRKEDVPAPIVRGMARDITDSKDAERAQRRSEQRFRATFEQAAVGIALVAPDGRWLQVNDKLCQIVGYSREELLARTFQDITHPDDLGADVSHLKQLLAGEIATYHTEKRYIRKGGETVWINLTVALARHRDGRPDYFITVIEDFQRRKEAEAAMHESEERFRAVVEQSISGACIIDAAGRFVYVNPRLAAILGYESGGSLEGRAVLEVVAPESHAVIRENMRQRIAGEPQQRRYHFFALRKDGTRVTLGAHANAGSYRGEPVLITTVQDVTELRRAEEEVERTIGKLQHALHSTIAVVSTIGELRDPYTHGHERRVGEVAAAIAAEMGLPEERVEGVRVIGYMHDVGKIAVPAEILAKPTRLSAAEFALVKQHAQQSYDILKGIEFPWPVAEAAWAHHERLDGSGYPRGLKGEQIILEARILAVADTVEAMSSHRPYRPGLGIDKALAEVERGRGSIYEPQAVDACLRLFRTKNYQLPA